VNEFARYAHYCAHPPNIIPTLQIHRSKHANVIESPRLFMLMWIVEHS
jgi:hypothetical protein